ncbi:MAG: hypothetical protein HDKAJFGB_02569 [Anaerolineae bacterium]|nr:hypothetical protein [Anaerolineae bacterium]
MQGRQSYAVLTHADHNRASAAFQTFERGRYGFRAAHKFKRAIRARAVRERAHGARRVLCRRIDDVVGADGLGALERACVGVYGNHARAALFRPQHAVMTHAAAADDDDGLGGLDIAATHNRVVRRRNGVGENRADFKRNRFRQTRQHARGHQKKFRECAVRLHAQNATIETQRFAAAPTGITLAAGEIRKGDGAVAKFPIRNVRADLRHNARRFMPERNRLVRGRDCAFYRNMQIGAAEARDLDGEQYLARARRRRRNVF